MSGDDFYFDTSALLPYYREEIISPAVQTVLSQTQPPVLLSDLTRVEMASAIARWTRMKEIGEPQAALIENTFEQDIRAGLYRVHPLAPIHYQKAEKWLSARKTALRTLDAIHIACCWTLHAKLITCDHTMHDAAEMLGLESVLIE
ncbi:MAG: type II toxin-antitoxin system VapC family toxin [Desulfobacterales bacterium]